MRESWSNLLWYVHSERERKGWLEDDVMTKIMFIKTKIINTLVKMDPSFQKCTVVCELLSSTSVINMDPYSQWRGKASFLLRVDFK